VTLSQRLSINSQFSEVRFSSVVLTVDDDDEKRGDDGTLERVLADYFIVGIDGGTSKHGGFTTSLNVVRCVLERTREVAV